MRAHAVVALLAIALAVIAARADTLARVGVRAGTTTEEALRNALAELGIDAEVVAVEDHQDGVAKLERGAISAYFADRAILAHLHAQSSRRASLRVSKRYFTSEAYALAFERGDGRFRLVVDRALSRVYRSGEIATVFANAFGPDAEPTDVLRALYRLNALPE